MRAAIERLRARAARRHVVVLRAQPRAEARGGRVGAPPPSAPAAALKRAFDPAGILNAGRGPIDDAMPTRSRAESEAPTARRPVARTRHALDRALIDKCVHCGFCLPTCPTYMLWGEEMDSPRGRIYLMKAGVEGRAEIDAVVRRSTSTACLGCLACVTACPSGVQYGPLIERTRAQIEQQYTRGRRRRLFRGAAAGAGARIPARMRLALLPLALIGRRWCAPCWRRLPRWPPDGLLARLRSRRWRWRRR